MKNENKRRNYKSLKHKEEKENILSPTIYGVLEEKEKILSHTIYGVL